MTTVKRGRGRPRRSDGPAIDLDTLLDNAARSFAINGFDATSVRKLAREIGISHSLAHHYYDTKLDLWKACIERGFGDLQREINRELQAALAQKQSQPALFEIISLYVRLSERFSDYVLILLQEAGRGGPRFDYLIKKYFKDLAPLSRKHFELAVQDGTVKDLPWQTVYSITLLAGPARHALAPLMQALGEDGDSDIDPEQHAQDVATLILNGVLAKPS